MTSSRETPLLKEEESRAVTAAPPSVIEIDHFIGEIQELLVDNRSMALGHLIYAALDHASAAISHPDQTFAIGIAVYRSKSRSDLIEEATLIFRNVKGWAQRNPVKVTLMVIGLGITAFKAKALAQCMLDTASSFCTWSKNQPLYNRFWGFVALMSVRLIVSTLVPPTSPGFGIIIQAATPQSEKWTAMPCFLLASAVAGAWPWILDKILSLCTRQDFCFTMAAKRFADNYPLTCWTGPAMREAFYRVYKRGHSGAGKFKYGKLGASFAVIVGHVVPFMGAQTTIMQRFFLPHPLDTIISQPFGMTEDLVSMAMAEATSSPILASWSLTALLVFFNLARAFFFSGTKEAEHTEDRALPYLKRISSRNIPSDGSATSSFSERNRDPSQQSLDAIPTHAERDYVALATAIVNILVGVGISFIVAGKLDAKEAFCVVLFQMIIQLVAVPVTLGHLGAHCVHHAEGRTKPPPDT